MKKNTSLLFLSHPLIFKMINISPKKQWISLIFLLFIILIFCGFNYFSLHKKQLLLVDDLQQYSLQLEHQKKITATLRKKNTSKLLTPEIGRALVPINQYINRVISTDMRLIFSQWEMHESPVLSLSLQGYFNNLHLFLTALLKEFPQLQLGDLSILRIKNDDEDFSIKVDILLLLNLKEE